MGAPVVLSLRYAVSEPRERRKTRIVIEGFGRFCRFVAVFYTLVCLRVNFMYAWSSSLIIIISITCQFICLCARKTQPVAVLVNRVCVLRSLSMGLFISVDYWWTTNVLLRGIEEVSPMLSVVKRGEKVHL